MVFLSIIGGAYFWFTDNDEPMFLDTTLDNYQAAIDDASAKCSKATEYPAPETCHKVIKALQTQIEKIIAAEKGSKKYKKELINLYLTEEKAHKKLGDTQSAININLKIIKIEPQVASHYSRLARYYVKTNARKEAVKYARLTTQLAPFRWQAFKIMGEALGNDQQYAKANDAYIKAIELAPSSKMAELDKLRQDLQTKQPSLTSPTE